MPRDIARRSKLAFRGKKVEKSAAKRGEGKKQAVESRLLGPAKKLLNRHQNEVMVQALTEIKLPMCFQETLVPGASA